MRSHRHPAAPLWRAAASRPPSTTRRALLCSTAPLLLLGAATAQAQPAEANYPNRPVTVVVASEAGSAPDQIARILSPHLSELLGQSVVIENRAGAGSTIGARLVADAQPNGHTLLLGTVASNASSPQTIKVPYHPIKSFAPVSFVASVPFVALVNPSLKVKNFRDFIALAKAKPGELNYSSPGRGGPQHLLSESFAAQTGIRMEHVPYKSGAATVMAVLSGDVAFCFSGMPPALPQVQSGKLVALAVTSAQRSPAAPNIPTMAEAGVPGMVAENWHVLYAPAKTPAPIVAKLADAMKTLLGNPKVKAQLAAVGAESRLMQGRELDDYLTEELKRWADAAKTSGVSVN